tara:strand:+ start:3161 stop:3670 length:510 start_codon:yes stop_codon:yes gene_type:complete
MTMRIGQGYDVHAFASVDSSPLDEGVAHIVMGGVSIPFKTPLLAHSDGDVLLHALSDALLGALALGDIGQHFPDNDNAYRNIDSRQLLRHVMKLIAERGYRLVNADMTIVAQRPKMAGYIPAMRDCIASDASVAVSAVSIKATTTEKLGFTGRGEGIACHAIVLLSQIT